MTERKFGGPCPRCGGELPNAYPGALSRADNRTEVCSDCGFDEGVRQWRGMRLQPVSEWPIECLPGTKPLGAPVYSPAMAQVIEETLADEAKR